MRFRNVRRLVYNCFQSTAYFLVGVVIYFVSNFIEFVFFYVKTSFIFVIYSNLFRINFYRICFFFYVKTSLARL